MALALVWPMAQAGGQAVPTPVAAPVTTAAGGACELHVWPSARMNIAFDPNGFLDDNTVTIKPMPGLDKDALILPDTQNRLFARMDLATMLGMAGAKIVLHDAPLPIEERRTNARRSQAPTACYAELIVLRIVYGGIVFGDRQLQSFFLFRRFDAGPAPTREFTQSGETGLHIFPPHNKEPVPPALAELDEAFKNDVSLFAGKLAAPPPPPRAHGRIDW